MLRSVILSAALMGASCLPALAQDFTAVQTINKLVKVESADGAATSTELVTIDSAAPGETIFYALNYDNGTDEAASNVKLVMAVPAEVTYLENTAASGDLEAAVAYSTDNGTSFAPRGELTVTLDGVEQPADSEDITHVRWAFQQPIQAGETGSVGFQAVVR